MLTADKEISVRDDWRPWSYYVLKVEGQGNIVGPQSLVTKGR